jgi:hypothetical protein
MAGSHNLRAIFSVVVLVILMSFQFLVTARTFYLTSYGPLSNVISILYTYGKTLAITLCASEVTRALRALFIQSIEDSLRCLDDNDVITDESNSDDTSIANQSISECNSRWRTIMNLDGDLPYTTKNYRTWLSRWWSIQGDVALTYFLLGTIVSAITASFAPSTAGRTYPYSAQIPDGGFGDYISDINHPCAGVVPSTSVIPSGNSLYWPLSNGSFWFGTYNTGWCPQPQAVSSASGINWKHPNDYSYLDKGVAVHKSAIGAPSTIYNGTDLVNAANKYKNYLLSTKQCVPVMVSNPVQCRPGGSTVITSDSTLRVTDDLDACPADVTFCHRSTSKDALMGTQLCAMPSKKAQEPDSIGVAVMTIGAISDSIHYPSNNWASDLARLVDYDFPQSSYLHNYTVTCTVDARQSFDYRWVTLMQKASNNLSSVPTSFYLSGGDPCTPKHPTIGNHLFVNAATANWQMLQQGFGLDGYIATLAGITKQKRKGPYAFNNSKNALEDTLGLISAVVVANLGINGGNVSAEAEGPNGNTTMIIEATRLGSDSWWTLFFIIPPLGCAVSLLWLIAQSEKHEWAPGGKGFRGRPYAERPGYYAGESIIELISIGRHRRLAPSHDSEVNASVDSLKEPRPLLDST